MIRIGVDAYGGDNAPEAVIEGALFALKNNYLSRDELVIIGNDLSNDFLESLKGVEVVPAKNLVTNDTKPTDVLKLEESSMYIGCKYLKKKVRRFCERR
jgi:Fatty acid/phospholipid biosynthesis enzyme